MRGAEEHPEPAHAAGPGDIIWLRRRRWRVRHASHGTGLTRLVVDAVSGAGSRTFLLPADRGHADGLRTLRDVSTRRALAWLAGCASRVETAYAPAAAVQADITLYPYQLEPALAVLAGVRRVLIADAVGLGKTIQASLIVSELTRRHPDSRVLLVVPPALIGQWSAELRTRFGIVALVADTTSFNRLRVDRPYLSSPWQGPGVWIASPDYLKQPHVIEAVPDAPFDLLVVDEAHTLAGHSQRRAATQALARRARRAVLLTATPHDGDEARYGRLLSLGATGTRADRLIIFRRTRTTRERRMRTLIASPSPSLTRVLNAIDAFERTMPANRGGALALICAVFRKRALSSSAAFAASLDRRQAVVDRTDEPDETWDQPGLFTDDLVPGNERDILRGNSGLPSDRERSWLQRLRYAAARSQDAKLTRLRSLLTRVREPVIVFTEYRDTLMAMAAALGSTRNVAVLHGGLPATRQGQVIGSFLAGHSDALLTTDVASQGINLQHRARWVVHFDVPWTPLRLEQRTGRVDRIGQTRRIHVTHVAVRHAADTALRDRLIARQTASEASHTTSCARWTRPAEGLTQTFRVQRTMASRWRGPDLVALPRAWVTRRLMQSICRSPLSCIAIVDIPILGDSGQVIERLLGWMPSDGRKPSGPLNPSPALLKRVRALSARARRRLSRELSAQARAEETGPTQPGLFEARGLPGSHETREAIDQPRNIDETRAAAVHVGSLRPLLILKARA